MNARQRRVLTRAARRHRVIAEQRFTRHRYGRYWAPMVCMTQATKTYPHSQRFVYFKSRTAALRYGIAFARGEAR